MVALQGIFLKAYWALAITGIIWAAFMCSLIIPTLQRQYVGPVILLERKCLDGRLI
jgi:hypothetical protein